MSCNHGPIVKLTNPPRRLVKPITTYPKTGDNNLCMEIPSLMVSYLPPLPLPPNFNNDACPPYFSCYHADLFAAY